MKLARAGIPTAIICIVLLAFGSLAQGQQQAAVKVFNNSIVPLPRNATAAAQIAEFAPASERTLLLHFALESANSGELTSRITRGEVIKPNELLTRYGGSKDSLDKLVSWLKSQGFTIVSTSPDLTGVYAKATVAQIERSLGAKMKVVSYEGAIGLAATTPPKLPIQVGAHVVAIDGLQEFVKAHKNSIPRAQYHRAKVLGSQAPVPRPMTATTSTYKVSDILSAYDAQGMGVTGRGQTIAILIDTLPEQADVEAFWQGNGLPANKRVQYINVQGNGTTLPPIEGEETLDTEWASGIAPGAAINVYAAGSLEYAYLDLALDRILKDVLANPGERHLSISLGLREDMVSADERAVEQDKFKRLAALGVTTFVSSGDAGSNPDSSGHGYSPDKNVEYEASDPWVIGVGGTTLNLNRVNGSIQSEVAWTDGGGGVSQVFTRPSWQPGIATIAPKNMRVVPDVSAVADPVPGAYVILNHAEWPVGGTSWSAPIWAGFAALIAEARMNQKKPPLSYLGPLLYEAPRGAFRDINAGSNGAYRATVGFDPVTGLGVPDMRLLIAALKSK